MLNERDLYLIGDSPGFTPQIGRLISMMNYARHTTLSAVEGLDVDEIDYLPDPQSNSIGALLLHKRPAQGESFDVIPSLPLQVLTRRSRGFVMANQALGQRGPAPCRL